LNKALRFELRGVALVAWHRVSFSVGRYYKDWRGNPQAWFGGM